MDLFHLGLDALPAHIAIVDGTGTILLVNQAWRRFAAANGAKDAHQVQVGTNYLAVCRKAAAVEADADGALAGISAVLQGTLPMFTLEYPCHSPHQHRWFLMTVSPWTTEGSSGAVICHQDLTTQKSTEHALRASEQRFRAMFNNSAVGIAEIGLHGDWLRTNARLRQLLGYTLDELAETTRESMIHPDDRDADLAHLEVMRSGATDCYSLEQRLLRKDGVFAWVNATFTCMRGGTGGIIYTLGMFEDISEHKRIEEHQHTLLQEIAHRGRNLLAVIQSVADRSLSGNRSLPDARNAFQGRLRALASSFTALTEKSFDGAALDTLLRHELCSFGGRAEIKGPSVLLTPKAAQTFALIAHELATNAAKYGALSVSEGKLGVSWHIQEDADQFVFEWRERGGPVPRQPLQLGFGTVLISRVAGAEFDCTPQLRYAPQGFEYSFTASLARLGWHFVDSQMRKQLQNTIVCSLYDTWKRVRVVEGQLPTLASFDWGRFAATGALTIATINANGAVQFVRVGQTLIETFGRPLRTEDLRLEDHQGLREAYDRCARKGEPCHERLKFDFGDTPPLTFERLLVPFAATAGGSVTHVIGVAVFEGTPQLHDQDSDDLPARGAQGGSSLPKS
jgi:PAS domain S-box-containing protein